MKNGIYLNDIPIDLFIDYFNESDSAAFEKHQKLIRNNSNFQLANYKKYPYLSYNGTDIILNEEDNKLINISSLPNYKAYIDSELHIKSYHDIPLIESKNDNEEIIKKSNLLTLSVYKKNLYYNNLIDCGEIDIFKGVPIVIDIDGIREYKTVTTLMKDYITIELVNFSSIYELINKNISIVLNNKNIVNSLIKKYGTSVRIESFNEIRFTIYGGKIKIMIPIKIEESSNNTKMIGYVIEKIVRRLKEVYRYKYYSDYYKTNITVISYTYVSEKFYSIEPFEIKFETDSKKFLYLDDLIQYFQNHNIYYETLSSQLRGKLIPDNVIYNEKKTALCDSLNDILNEKQSLKYDELITENGFYKVNSFCTGISEFIKMDETTNEQIQLFDRNLISIDDIDYIIKAENTGNNIIFSLNSPTENNKADLTGITDDRKGGIITRIKEYKDYPLVIDYLKAKQKKDNMINYKIETIGEPIISVDTTIKKVSTNYDLYQKTFKNIKEKAIDTFVFYIKNINLMKPNDYYNFQNKESEFLEKIENIEGNLKKLINNTTTEKAIFDNINDVIKNLFSTWRVL